MNWQLSKIREYYRNKDQQTIDTEKLSKELIKQGIGSLRDSLKNINLKLPAGMIKKYKKSQFVSGSEENNTNNDTSSLTNKRSNTNNTNTNKTGKNKTRTSQSNVQTTTNQPTLGISEVQSFSTSSDNSEDGSGEVVEMVAKRELGVNELPIMRGKLVNPGIKSHGEKNNFGINKGKRENIQVLIQQNKALLEEIEVMVRDMPFFIKFDKATRLLLLENSVLKEYKRGEFVVK